MFFQVIFLSKTIRVCIPNYVTIFFIRVVEYIVLYRIYLNHPRSRMQNVIERQIIGYYEVPQTVQTGFVTYRYIISTVTAIIEMDILDYSS